MEGSSSSSSRIGRVKVYSVDLPISYDDNFPCWIKTQRNETVLQGNVCKNKLVHKQNQRIISTIQGLSLLCKVASKITFLSLPLILFFMPHWWYALVIGGGAVIIFVIPQLLFDRKVKAYQKKGQTLAIQEGLMKGNREAPISEASLPYDPRLISNKMRGEEKKGKRGGEKLSNRSSHAHPAIKHLFSDDSVPVNNLNTRFDGLHLERDVVDRCGLDPLLSVLKVARGKPGDEFDAVGKECHATKKRYEAAKNRYNRDSREVISAKEDMLSAKNTALKTGTMVGDPVEKYLDNVSYKTKSQNLAQRVVHLHRHFYDLYNEIKKLREGQAILGILEASGEIKEKEWEQDVDDEFQKIFGGVKDFHAVTKEEWSVFSKSLEDDAQLITHLNTNYKRLERLYEQIKGQIIKHPRLLEKALEWEFFGFERPLLSEELKEELEGFDSDTLLLENIENPSLELKIWLKYHPEKKEMSIEEVLQDQKLEEWLASRTKFLCDAVGKNWVLMPYRKLFMWDRDTVLILRGIDKGGMSNQELGQLEPKIREEFRKARKAFLKGKGNTLDPRDPEKIGKYRYFEELLSEVPHLRTTTLGEFMHSQSEIRAEWRNQLKKFTQLRINLKTLHSVEDKNEALRAFMSELVPFRLLIQKEGNRGIWTEAWHRLTRVYHTNPPFEYTKITPTAEEQIEAYRNEIREIRDELKLDDPIKNSITAALEALNAIERSISEAEVKALGKTLKQNKRTRSTSSSESTTTEEYNSDRALEAYHKEIHLPLRRAIWELRKNLGLPVPSKDSGLPVPKRYWLIEKKRLENNLKRIDAQMALGAKVLLFIKGGLVEIAAAVYLVVVWRLSWSHWTAVGFIGITLLGDAAMFWGRRRLTQLNDDLKEARYDLYLHEHPFKKKMPGTHLYLQELQNTVDRFHLDGEKITIKKELKGKGEGTIKEAVETHAKGAVNRTLLTKTAREGSKSLLPHLTKQRNQLEGNKIFAKKLRSLQGDFEAFKIRKKPTDFPRDLSRKIQNISFSDKSCYEMLKTIKEELASYLNEHENTSTKFHQECEKLSQKIESIPKEAFLFREAEVTRKIEEIDLSFTTQKKRREQLKKEQLLSLKKELVQFAKSKFAKKFSGQILGLQMLLSNKQLKIQQVEKQLLKLKCALELHFEENQDLFGQCQALNYLSNELDRLNKQIEKSTGSLKILKKAQKAFYDKQWGDKEFEDPHDHLSNFSTFAESQMQFSKEESDLRELENQRDEIEAQIKEFELDDQAQQKGAFLLSCHHLLTKITLICPTFKLENEELNTIQQKVATSKRELIQYNKELDIVVDEEIAAREAIEWVWKSHKEVFERNQKVLKKALDNELPLDQAPAHVAAFFVNKKKQNEFFLKHTAGHGDDFDQLIQGKYEELTQIVNRKEELKIEILLRQAHLESDQQKEKLIKKKAELTSYINKLGLADNDSLKGKLAVKCAEIDTKLGEIDELTNETNEQYQIFIQDKPHLQQLELNIQNQEWTKRNIERKEKILMRLDAKIVELCKEWDINDTQTLYKSFQDEEKTLIDSIKAKPENEKTWEDLVELLRYLSLFERHDELQLELQELDANLKGLKEEHRSKYDLLSEEMQNELDGKEERAIQNMQKELEEIGRQQKDLKNKGKQKL